MSFKRIVYLIKKKTLKKSLTEKWMSGFLGSFLVQKGQPYSCPCYYLHRFTGSPCRSSPNMPVLQLSGHNIPILSPVAMHTGRF